MPSQTVVKTNARAYQEHTLRNYVNTQLKKKSRTRCEGKWRTIFTELGLMDEIRAPVSGIPICGGIMLALYEQLAKAGYEKVVEFYPETDKAAIENAHRLYGILQRALPEDKRWQMRLEDARYY